MTFDHADLAGSTDFQPVPPGSALWNAGDGTTVKQPKKAGKGGQGNGNTGPGVTGPGNGGPGNGGGNGNGNGNPFGFLPLTATTPAG
jgi:hypothetical protein